MKIKIKLDDGVPMPERATTGSSGVDLRAQIDVSLRPGDRALVPTGIRLEMPVGVEAQVRSRSGLAMKHGVVVLNSPGTVDADFRGEVGVVLINLGQSTWSCVQGERIAQLVFAPVLGAAFQATGRLALTGRGDGGFGSSGR